MTAQQTRTHQSARPQQNQQRPQQQQRKETAVSQSRQPTPIDTLHRLVQLEAEMERLEAEAQALRNRLKNYLSDLPEPVLVDEVDGIEARIVTVSRRTIDAKKVPASLLATLAERDLVTVKVAAAPIVPPDSVAVTTTEQLRIKRVK